MSEPNESPTSSVDPSHVVSAPAIPEHGWADLLASPTLRCADGCDATTSDETPQTNCPGCGRASLACVYEGGERAGLRIRAQAGPGLIRWRALLPIRSGETYRRVTLGEGDSPLLSVDRLAASCGLGELLVKDESTQPMGSFKARGFSVLVMRALEHGVEELIAPSAGNAAVALSAYAARAGIAASVFVPEDLPRTFVDAARDYGARVTATGAHMAIAGKAAAAYLEEARAAGRRVHPVGTLREPYRVEGKKTMGLELWEQTGGDLPDAIIYPTGGGTGLLGIEKALLELQAAGLIATDARLPRLYAVQLAGCRPLVSVFESQPDGGGPVEEVGADHAPPAASAALGLRVARPASLLRLVRVLQRTGGGAVSVDDGAIESARADLFGAGIDAAPEGAATLAALRALRASGTIAEGSRVVLLNTASMARYVGL